MPTFEILRSFFNFHFAVFYDDHGACSAKHVAADEKWVGVCSVFGVCAWCMKGKKGVTKRTGGTTKHQRQHHAQCCNGHQTHRMQHGAQPVVGFT